MKSKTQMIDEFKKCKRDCVNCKTTIDSDCYKLLHKILTEVKDESY